MVSLGAFWQLAYAPYVRPDLFALLAARHRSAPSLLVLLLGHHRRGGRADDPGRADRAGRGGRRRPQAISRLTGPASIAIVLLFAPGVAVAGAICLYGGALAVITFAQTFSTGWRAVSHGYCALIATAIFVAALPYRSGGCDEFLCWRILRTFETTSLLYPDSAVDSP